MSEPAAEAQRPEPYPLTDAGNAERFVLRHSFGARFVHGWNRWHVWDGRRWAPDETCQVIGRAIETARDMLREAAGLEEEGLRKAMIRHAQASESGHRIDAMLRLAAANREMAVRPTDLDRDPWVLNVANGTIDLKTGKLRSHKRDDLITRLSPVRYEADATSPTWSAFLARITGGNRQLEAFLRRAIGYSITGDVAEHALFLAYGSGANGKSTLMETVLAILGEYGKAAAPGLLMRTRDGRHEEQTAELQGVRFATGQESGVDQAFDEPRLKLLTGGDTVSARRLYAARFEFKPTHKIWVGTNHKPRVRGGDDGIWRRLKLIPFDQVIGEHERDSRLKDKLLAEAPGILAWAVRGCLEWQTAGLGVPDEVREATASYRAAEDQVGPFMDERCTLSLTASVPASRLHEAYREWAEAAGERPMSQQAFAEALEARGFERKRTKSTRMWVGLALRSGPGDAVTDQPPFSDNFSARTREGELS